MILKYLSNRVLLILSALALALGILALILIFGFKFDCRAVPTTGAGSCDAGISGLFGTALILPYVVVAAIVSVLALVKSGVTRQYLWFAAIFLASIFLLGPLVVLPFSLLTPNERTQTVKGLRRPDSDDLRDYRSPRPA